VTTYRLFPSTDGPSSATAYSGYYQAGVVFQVTSNGLWFDGYWWWVCNSGQQTGAVTFALWQPVNEDTWELVPGSSVTSGTLTAGQWNYVPLSTAIGLSATVPYTAVAGFDCTDGFPYTAGQFGSGDTYSAGITNGPLSAYSDSGGSSPPPASQSQGLFGTGSTSSGNADANYPSLGSDGSSNFWMDVQVDTSAPSGASYRLWPSQPYAVNYADDTAENFTLGTEFSLSEACTLDRIWFYSPSGVTQLPTACGIWDVSTASLVAGTDNTSPSWSGEAGSGWVYCDYTSSGVTLAAGTNYKVAVCNGAGSPAVWNGATGPDYWASPGPGESGITSGPLSAPDSASATSPGQSTYNAGAAFTYPDTYNAGAYTYWVDVEVTPLAVFLASPNRPRGQAVNRASTY
jgi:hypothetical protein